jgi:hypothetical protein
MTDTEAALLDLLQRVQHLEQEAERRRFAEATRDLITEKLSTGSSPVPEPYMGMIVSCRKIARITLWPVLCAFRGSSSTTPRSRPSP